MARGVFLVSLGPSQCAITILFISIIFYSSLLLPLLVSSAIIVLTSTAYATCVHDILQESLSLHDRCCRYCCCRDWRLQSSSLSLYCRNEFTFLINRSWYWYCRCCLAVAVVSLCCYHWFIHVAAIIVASMLWFWPLLWPAVQRSLIDRWEARYSLLEVVSSREYKHYNLQIRMTSSRWRNILIVIIVGILPTVVFCSKYTSSILFCSLYPI